MEKNNLPKTRLNVKFMGDGTVRVTNLVQGASFIIDEHDLPKIAGLCFHKKRASDCIDYWQAYDSADCKYKYLHRIITACPDNLTVNHRNGNVNDNRRENLEICTRAYNSSVCCYKSRSTKYADIPRNIYPQANGKFKVQISRGLIGERRISRTFGNLEDAVRWREEQVEEIRAIYGLNNGGPTDGSCE